ncbi:MAG: histidine phosphatase family protein [Chloroflexia bacterium]
MRLLLVRHGQTVGNILRQLQDDHDPLTELGRRQAREVAAHLATLGAVEALYCSPLQRALDTAQVIGAAIGHEPEARPAWAEINVGRAAGHTFDGWREQFPEESAAFRADGVGYRWPGGENGFDVARRTADEIEWLLARHGDAGAPVIVVSHGGALAWAISYLLREPGDRWPREHMRLDNCSLTEVALVPATWAAGQPATFVCRNVTDHLAALVGAEISGQ